MTSMTRQFAALTILLLAAACTPPLVATPPSEPIQIGFYSVTPQTEWNRAMMTRKEVWTVDGYALQALRFLDVADGQTLSGETDPDGKAPVYRKSMLPNEIQEFIVETLVAGGWANVESGAATRFAPAPDSIRGDQAPDRPLRGVTFAPYPESPVDMAFHYANPVSGKRPPIYLPEVY